MTPSTTTHFFSSQLRHHRPLPQQNANSPRDEFARKSAKNYENSEILDGERGTQVALVQKDP
jgi:hypothetical protein